MLRAQVRGGTVVVDEPNSLEEGDIVLVIPVSRGLDRALVDNLASSHRLASVSRSLDATIEETLSLARTLTRSILGDDRSEPLATVEVMPADGSLVHVAARQPPGSPTWPVEAAQPVEGAAERRRR